MRKAIKPAARTKRQRDNSMSVFDLREGAPEAPRARIDIKLLFVAALIGAAVMFGIYYVGFAGVEGDLREQYPALHARPQEK